MPSEAKYTMVKGEEALFFIGKYFCRKC